MPATKTRTRSPFQAANFGSILVHRTGAAVAPSEADNVSTCYVEYANAEQTIVVMSDYRDYSIAVRTDLTVDQVLSTESYLRQEGYENTLARGVWIVVQDRIGSKTRARAAAEVFLTEVQDVEHPVVVTLDGKHGPALTIALQEAEKQAARYGYRTEDRDNSARREALRDLAKEAKVNVALLALAVKEDRLIWSTPPVAPKQVMVVVNETETGVLSERLVDEIVLATGEVEGLGRIVHQGSVGEHLLARRGRHQAYAVREILERREALGKALQEIKARADRLLEELADGGLPGRGFHDTLNLGREVEQAQSAATSYAAAVVNADLPEAYNLRLRKGEFHDEEERYGSVYADTRRALEALSALNGLDIKSRDF